MTPLELTLISAIGIALVGIAGFITWFAKLVIPKFLEYSDRLVIEIAEFRKEFTKIPETMVRFEAKLDQNTVITTETKGEVQKMRQELFDQKFKDLQDQIDKATNSRHTIPPLNGKN